MSPRIERMSARNLTRLSIVATVAIAALLAASCEEGPAGIFSRVSAERSTTAGMTDDIQYSTPSFVVRLGETYYAGIGSFWMKGATATAWSPVGADALAPIRVAAGLEADASLFAGSGAVAGGTMYVLFSEASTGANIGVWATTDGAAWHKVSDGLPASGGVQRLLVANGELFAAVATSRLTIDEAPAYSLYRLSGAAFVATGFLDESDAALRLPASAAWDGSNYWFTAGARLVRGAAPATLDVVAPSWAGAMLNGVCAVDGGIIVATDDGYLRYTADGSSWTSSEQQLKTKKVLSLSAPTYVPGTKSLAVGTNKIARSSSDTPSVDGYLEFDLSAGFVEGAAAKPDHSLFSTAINFDSSLSGKSVRSMPFFDHGDGVLKLFALCDGQGLWSNAYDTANLDALANGWSGWIRE
jgi:hypothetical protein